MHIGQYYFLKLLKVNLKHGNTFYTHFHFRPMTFTVHKYISEYAHPKEGQSV
jgi:hypothetical protein